MQIFCFIVLPLCQSILLAGLLSQCAEFQYPAEWLADQTLYRRAVQRAEAARSLDPQPIKRQRKEVAEPTVAFGPAGSTWVPMDPEKPVQQLLCRAAYLIQTYGR